MKWSSISILYPFNSFATKLFTTNLIEISVKTWHQVSFLEYINISLGYILLVKYLLIILLILIKSRKLYKIYIMKC